MENIIKSERIDIRLSNEDKKIIEKAASINNMSLSSYILFNILKLAKNDLERFEITLLDNDEMSTFINLLTNPPKPNESLIELFK